MLLYAITDRRSRPDLQPEEMVDRLVRSGADMIQIREKDLSPRLLLPLVARAVAARSAEVFVNARADVALGAGAGGVHLPSAGLPVALVKARFGDSLRVGASTHSLEGALAAQAAGADLVVFGPVYETESKRTYGPPLGVARLAEVVAALHIPVFAIGGIDETHMPELVRARVAGAAVISAILRAPDMARAVSRLRAGAAR